MPGTREGGSRDTLKVHLDVFKHLTTLSAAVVVAFFALDEGFSPYRVIAISGAVVLALTVLVGVFGIWMVSHVLRSPRPSHLAFWFSEVLVGLACFLFFLALLTVVDIGLRDATDVGLFGWMWDVMGRPEK